MQGGRDPFFGSGDPFGNFGGFGGYGGQRSLVSSFFGGRDPFDDPFFRQPFGSMFEPSFFGNTGGPFMNQHASGFLQHQLPASGFLQHQLPASGFLQHQLPTSGFLQHQLPQPAMSRGPVIEELNSDEENDEDKKENPRKHGRSSKEPFVEDPDDEVTEKKSKYMPRTSDTNQIQHARSQPKTHSFTFQSSTVSYGGANGAYYTSSTTRRAGNDGLKFEECKEANSSTGQASHRVSRGIHDKGHSVTRKLKSDGHVDRMQTLHNLNEDELQGFEESWKGNARKHLPGWNEGFATRNVIGSGSSTQHTPIRGGWALPSTERSDIGDGSRPTKMTVGPSHGTGSSRSRSNGNGQNNQVGKR